MNTIDRLEQLCNTVDASNSRLTFKQLRALILLQKAGDKGLVKTQLGKACGMSPGGISRACDTLGSKGRILNSLEKTRNLEHTHGWLREEDHPTDRRQVMVYLTELGQQYLNQLSEIVEPGAIHA